MSDVGKVRLQSWPTSGRMRPAQSDTEGKNGGLKP